MSEPPMMIFHRRTLWSGSELEYELGVDTGKEVGSCVDGVEQVCVPSQLERTGRV